MPTDEEALFAQLEDVFAAVDAEGVQNLQDLPLEELLTRSAELDGWLKENEQVIALNPDTQKARDVHADRVAVRLELIRRGVL